jgi:hypothetical protein
MLALGSSRIKRAFPKGLTMKPQKTNRTYVELDISDIR